MRHDVAALVGVEVADGQALHVVEHLVPDLHERALRHHGSELVVDDVADERDHVDDGEVQDDLCDGAAGARPVTALPVLSDDVDGLLHEDRRQGRQDGGREDADDDDGHEAGIVGDDHLEEGAERGHGILGSVPTTRLWCRCLRRLLLRRRCRFLLLRNGVVVRLGDLHARDGDALLGGLDALFVVIARHGPRPPLRKSALRSRVRPFSRRAMPCSGSCRSLCRSRWCAGGSRECRWRRRGRRP